MSPIFKRRGSNVHEASLSPSESQDNLLNRQANHSRSFGTSLGRPLKTKIPRSTTLQSLSSRKVDFHDDHVPRVVPSASCVPVVPLVLPILSSPGIILSSGGSNTKQHYQPISNTTHSFIRPSSPSTTKSFIPRSKSMQRDKDSKAQTLKVPKWRRDAGPLPPLPRAKTIGDFSRYRDERRMSIVEERDMRAGLEFGSPEVSHLEAAWAAHEKEKGSHQSYSSSSTSSPKSPITPRGSTGDGEKKKPSPLTRMWKDDERNVSEAQERGYWCGRFTTLYDKFSTEEELLPITTSRGRMNRRSRSSRGSDTQQEQGAAETRRMKRVFSQLSNHCVADAAKDSLRKYQTQYAKLTGNPSILPSKNFGEKLGDVWGKVKGNWKKSGQENQ